MRTWAGALLLAVVMAPAPGYADATIHVLGTPEGCPTAAAVAAAIKELLPSVVVTAAGVAPAGATEVHCTDLGERYRVALGQAAREVVDADRRCEERARVAAVFVTLALFPPAAGAQAPASGPASPAAASQNVAPRPVSGAEPAASTHTPKPGLDLFLETAALLAVAPQGDLVAGGGTLRVHLAYRWIGFALGATGQSDVRQKLKVGSARLRRVPFDLDLRATARVRRFEIGGEVGLAATYLGAAGQGLNPSMPGKRLELGVRVAAVLRVWLQHWLALLATVETTFIPSPYDLQIAPAGIVGRTPRAWVGLLAGIAWKLR